MIMNTMSTTTAKINTPAAGQMLVVVVSGARGWSLTGPIPDGRWARGPVPISNRPHS